MNLSFSWYNIFMILLCLILLWMGVRDLQGKDPLIHTFFNKYDRGPGYRTMWQKKNGVWEISNAVCIGCIQLLGRHPVLCSRLYTVVFILDMIYFILYEIWEHSAD
mgnify:FL=1